jgi:competence protein ComEC
MDKQPMAKLRLKEIFPFISYKNFSGLLPFLLFVSFALGVILGRYFTFNGISIASGVISLGAIYLFYRRRKLFASDVFILIFFLFAGSTWIIPDMLSHKNTAFLLHKENSFVIKVISFPQKRELYNTVLAEAKVLNNIPVKMKIKVRDYTRKMRYLHSYKGRGKLNTWRYGRRRFYHLWVKSTSNVEELPMNFFDKLIFKATNYFLSVFKNNLNEGGYRFLSSVFLGRREFLGEEKRIFQKAGVSHLLAISGLHIGITSLILFFILKFFNLKFRLCLFISIIFLYLYTFITGASSSTLRAAIMYSVFALGFFLKRRVSLMNSLGIAGLISLMINPAALFEVGFQLSFLSVFSIIAGFNIFHFRSLTNPFLNYLKHIFFASIFVTVTITPLVSYYFGKIYIFSIFYNVILIPFFSFILLINFIFLIFSPFQLIASCLGAGLSFLINTFISFTSILGSFKLSFFSYTFPLYSIFIYYLLLCSFFIFISLTKRGGFDIFLIKHPG